MKINLLQEEVKKYGKVEKIKRLNRLVVIVSTCLFVTLLLWLSGQYLYFSLKLKSASADRDRLEKQYNSRASDIVKYIRIKKTLIEEQNIVESRLKYEELVRNVLGTFPSSVALTGTEFPTEKMMKVRGSAPGIRAYDAFLRLFEEKSRSSEFMFSSAVQKGLSRSDAGKYQFDLELLTKK